MLRFIELLVVQESQEIASVSCGFWSSKHKPKVADWEYIQVQDHISSKWGISSDTLLQQLFIEHLLSSGHCSRHLGYIVEQNQ